MCDKKSTKEGEMMTDTTELKVAILRAGISHDTIAYKLGIARETLWKKINNITEFKAREIMLLQDILHLSNSERDSIFFSLNGDK